MAKKKNQKKAEAQAKKSAVETLRFQAHWGLKRLSHEDDMFNLLVDAEVDFIAELELAHDMLAIKSGIYMKSSSVSIAVISSESETMRASNSSLLSLLSLNNSSSTIWRTRQTLWSAVQMLTQKLCCQTIHDCPKVVPLHYESE